jgi:hypothetical protein
LVRHKIATIVAGFGLLVAAANVLPSDAPAADNTARGRSPV